MKLRGARIKRHEPGSGRRILELRGAKSKRYEPGLDRRIQELRGTSSRSMSQDLVGGSWSSEEPGSRGMSQDHGMRNYIGAGSRSEGVEARAQEPEARAWNDARAEA